MCTKQYSTIKAIIISGLFALSAFNYGTAQAAATVSAPTVTTVSAAFSIDTTAVDFYIFGENVQKSGGTVFSDVTGNFQQFAMASPYSVAWTGGSPTVSSTGSTKYDVCAFGIYNPLRATACSFSLKMPSSTATLDVWLIPDGYGGTLTYDITVGGVKNSYSDASGTKRLTYSITNAMVGETVTVQVDNAVGSNGWHNVGFQAAQLNPIKLNQIIFFETLSGKTFGDADFTVSATATSKLPVNFSATGSCSITSSTLKITAAGDCNIKASQAGDTTYNAAPDVTQTITISKANQIITFAPASTGTAGQSTTLSATATSGLTITLASSTPTICTVSGNVVSFVSAGTCNVTANHAGNTNYNAATEVVKSIVVSLDQIVKKDQIVTFSSELFGTAGESAILTATVDSSLTPITFTAYPVEICEVVGNNITYKAEGTCSIIAKQAGNEQFNPVEQKVDVSVMSKGVFSLNITDKDNLPLFQAIEGDVLNISLTFQAATVDVGKSALFYLKAVAGNTSLMLTRDGFVAATNPLQPMSSTPTVLTAESVTLPIYSGVLPVGKYTIYAEYQTTDGKKQEATSVLTVKAKQILSFTNLPTMVTVGESFFVMLSKGASNNPVILISTTTDICTVQGQTVSFIAEGSCVLSAQQNGNEFFADVQVTGEIRVGSAGTFSLNVTDKNNLPIFQTIEGDVLNISLTFKAPSADIGKSALFYLTVKYFSEGNVLIAYGSTVVLVLTPQGFSGYTYPLPSISSTPSVLSQESITVPLYSGALWANKYTVEAWYVTTDGNIRRATSVINVLAKRYVDTYAVAITRGKSVAYAMAYAGAIYLGKTEMYATTYALQYESQIISGKSVAYATVYATAYANSYTTAKAAGYSEFRATNSARNSAQSYTSPFMSFVSRLQNTESSRSLPHLPIIWW